MTGRFWNAAHVAEVGLDDETSAELLSDKKATFGELDGDYAPPNNRIDNGEVRIAPIEETLDFYAQHNPEGITILRKPEEENED
jgi:hypothetical protein